MNKVYVILIVVFVFSVIWSCDQKREGYPHNMLAADTARIYSEKQVDEFIVFRAMIDTIYPIITDQNFDTISDLGLTNVLNFEDHRIIAIILAKNQLRKNDLGKITNLFSCVCKHKSVRKMNSADLVIEEYLFRTAEDASFWFDKIYGCYMDNENPLGEPLKEPYKLWQSSNRLLHVYTRAQMWSGNMVKINEAVMKSFVFAKEE